LRIEISSNPSFVRFAYRSRPALASAATRSQMRPTVRHAIRISWQIALFDVLTTSQAACSSKLRVNPAWWRAQGTAATTTPWTLHSTRGASASKKQNVVPRSSARHRRRPSPRS